MIKITRPYLVNEFMILGPDLRAEFTIEVPVEHVAEFKELVFRATNLWPDSSAAIKIFADELIHGKSLQPYEEMYKPITRKN